MTPRLAWTAFLILAACAAWIASAYSWFFCIATIVLLPLAPVIFLLSAIVTWTAYQLSVVALDSAIDCFTKEASHG